MSRTLSDDNLVVLTATITDGDGDTDTDFLNIGKSLSFVDDAPSITVPIAAAGIDISGAVGGYVTTAFDYTLGNDTHNAAFYTGGGSDFTGLPTLTGTVDFPPTGSPAGAEDPAITNVVVTKTSEDANDAFFHFAFDYDNDPIQAGVQPGHAEGNLQIDKDGNTIGVQITNATDGFSFTFLQTSEFLAKEPGGNTGHPNIVVERLAVDDAATPLTDEDFYVQFTANTTTNQIGFGLTTNNGEGAPQALAGTSFNAGETVTNVNEDWVSATRTTNGVAGDTIQKGELLTLRFFNQDVLGDVAAGNERVQDLTNQATADGVVIKFDGITNSATQGEDLMLILSLIDKDGADNNILTLGDNNALTTKAIRIDNQDMYFSDGNSATVTDLPVGYRGDFNFTEGAGNNDSVAIIEKNDFNTGTENWEIIGVQIMQSANGLTGSAIDLNKAVGAAGASTGTQLWESRR